MILLTLVVRLALMPISLTSALRMQANKRKMQLLKPQLEALKALHGDDKAELSSETMRLYRESGVTWMDRIMLGHIATQSLFGIGLFQVLNKAAITSKFLWIANLAKPDLWLSLLIKPDLWLSLLIVVLMLLSMALMPGATAETSHWVTMLVSMAVIGAVVFAMPSLVGIYVATSSAVAVLQACVVRAVINSQRNAAA